MESVLLTVRSDDSNPKICSNVKKYFIECQKSDYRRDPDYRITVLLAPQILNLNFVENDNLQTLTVTEQARDCLSRST